MKQPEQAALIGTWHLTQMEVRYADGTISYPWGKEPVGQIIYTSEGWMSVVIMHPERKRFAANDILGGSQAEQASAARSYLSYVGSYTLDEDKVIHAITASLFPNWVGQEQIRFIDEITPQRLVLRTPPTPAGGQPGVGYLIWERASKA